MDHSLRLGKLNTGVLTVCVSICAIGLALALGAGQASAANITGGVSMDTPSSSKPAQTKPAKLAPRFGNRALREGMTGPDVKILKGIARSQSLLGGPLTSEFDEPTTDAVKQFQSAASIRASGVVNKNTAKSMIRKMRRTEASWYGPGLYGNGVACGGTLRPGTVGVAHKTLPCGSKVLVGYKGRYLMTKVIDRGPYIAGRSLDLTYAGAEALNFIESGVANVRWAVVKRAKK